MAWWAKFSIVHLLKLTGSNHTHDVFPVSTYPSVNVLPVSTYPSVNVLPVSTYPSVNT